MSKLVIDVGHGINTAGKRSPAGEREWSFNNEVAVATIKELKNYPSISILRVDDETGKTDVSLSSRTDQANKWGADAYVSFHHNANNGKWGSWGGTETYTYPNSSANSKKLAKIVHSKMVKAYGLQDRGLKEANFHVLRETKAPAILIEGGFMDSIIDIDKMRDSAVMQKVGISIALGIAEHFGASRKVVVTAKPTSWFYTVKSGDTLWSIAKDNGISVEEIKSFNGLKGNIIYKGDKLSVTKESPKQLLEVIVESLWYYGSANWTDKVDLVHKGAVFTIADTVKVGGSTMYKLKSGTFITANPKYVKLIK